MSKKLSHLANSILIAMGISLATSIYADVDEDIIQQSFFPYADPVPYPEGFEPGMVINSSNVEQFKSILDDATYNLVKDGSMEMKTEATLSFDVIEAYVQATRENAGSVKLTEEGNLDGYVSGRAFPQQPDINDPRAGLKLMWNFQRGLYNGESSMIEPFYWTYRDMKKNKAERVLSMFFHSLTWEHRSIDEPKGSVGKNPSNVFRTMYLRVLEPFDLANTQLLIHRYQEDTKRDDAWLYLGFQRRVRRLATGQTTDSFLGSDLMIEDFEGYNGMLSDYNWEYKGNKWVLLSWNDYAKQTEFSELPENDPDGFKMVPFTGKGGCFPNTAYQLRKTHIIIGTPKAPDHPIGKRVIYMDAQTGRLPRTEVYDRRGDLWKWFNVVNAHPDSHLPSNKGAGVPIWNAASLVDVQAEHCTVLQFKVRVHQQDVKQSDFGVQYLRKSAR